MGSISLVAPIAGTGALVPIAFGLATGDAVTRAERAGFALALLAVVLASIERRKGAAPHVAAGVVLAVVAAVTGGLNVIFLRDASRGGVLWTLVAQRVTVAGFAFAFAMTVGSGIAITRSVRRDVLAVGVIDVVATGCFAAATNRGMLSVVAAIGALFPVATVLLARWVLHERLSLVQRIGVTGAMAAVVLLIVLRAG